MFNVRPIAFSTIYYSRRSHHRTARLLQNIFVGSIYTRARAHEHTDTHAHTHPRDTCAFVLFSLENGSTGLNNSCLYTRACLYWMTSKTFIFLMRKVTVKCWKLLASWVLSAQNMYRVSVKMKTRKNVIEEQHIFAGPMHTFWLHVCRNPIQFHRVSSIRNTTLTMW